MYPSKIIQALSANFIEYARNDHGKVIVATEEVKSMTSDSFVNNILSFISDIKSIDDIQSKFEKMEASTDGADLVISIKVNNEYRVYRLRDGNILDKYVKDK